MSKKKPSAQYLKDQLLEAKKKQLENLNFLKQYQADNRIEYFNSGKPLVDGSFLNPNPKQQVIIDGWRDLSKRIMVYSGGNRCLGGNTEIYDPVMDKHRIVSEIDSDFHVYSWDAENERLVTAKALKPFIKQLVEPVYKITTKSGKSFEASGGHRIWAGCEYIPISSLLPDIIVGGNHQESPRSLFVSELGMSNLQYLRLCNEQLSLAKDSKLFKSDTTLSVRSNIDKIEYVRDDVKWDFHVPVWNNYYLSDFIHKNSGKTTIGTILAYCTMFGEYPWSGEKLLFSHSHPRKIRIVGQDWEKHVGGVIVPELRYWWPKNRELKTRRNNSGVEYLWTDLKTGSTIELMTEGSDSDLFEGWKGDLVYYDEPPKRDIRIACRRGLLDRKGREYFGMTLLKQAWINREIINRKSEDGSPDKSVLSIVATMFDNAGYGIPESEIYEFMKDLTPEEIQIRVYGVPAFKAGLVCPEFVPKMANEGGHLVEPFNIPFDYMVDIAIDVHPQKPQAILFMATNQQGYRYLFHEILGNGDGTWIGEQIVRVATEKNLRVNKIICDPLAKGDGNNTNTVFDKINHVLVPHGYPRARVASKDKSSGILLINSALMGPNKIPSLFFFSNLKRTISEIESWVYVKDKHGNFDSKPSKEFDDMMENCYRLMLLNTKWLDPRDEVGNGAHYNGNQSVNKTTGY